MPGALSWTARAEQDLIDIWHGIAGDNPLAADRLLDSIDARCQILVAFPQAGPARDDIAPGLRYLVHRRYLIFYRLTAEGAEIVRVVHGHRRFTDLF